MIASVRASRNGEPSDRGLVIEGHLECTMAHHEKTVTVSKHARVKASVKAETVTVFGQVIGNIYSNGVVLLSRGSRVTGDIYCPRIIIEEGVKFGGSISSDGKVLISRGSEVNADISCPRIIIEEGAKFGGSINTDALTKVAAPAGEPGQDEDDDMEEISSHIPARTPVETSLSGSNGQL